MQFFEYLEKDSVLHRLNPSVKLLLIMALMFAVTFVYDPYTPFTFAVLGILQLTVLGKIPITRIARMILPLSFILLAITVTSIIAFDTSLEQNPSVVLNIRSFIITEASIMFGLTIGLRIFCFLLYSIMFVATTDPTDFILSLILQLKLSPRIGYGTLAGYRFVPLLGTEYQNIHQAHMIRGSEQRAGLIQKFSRLKRYSVPLLVGAIRKAQRVAIAMDSKGFLAYPKRTYLRDVRIRRPDIIYLTLVLLTYTLLLILLTRYGIASWGYRSLR